MDEQRKDQWLTTAQVAERLGVRPKIVLAHIHHHRIIAVDVSAAAKQSKRSTRKHRPVWRIDPREIEAFRRRRQNLPDPVPLRRRSRALADDVIQFV